MALRGITPNKIEKRLKCLFYGPAGVGKTMASIQFPHPYLIDTEKGAENDQYLKILEQNGGAIFQADNFDEILEEIKSLLTEEHPYKTLIIDPLTTIYNDLIDKSSIKVGTDFGKHYSETNKKMKYLLNFLLKLDMNVIITSHSKNEYGKDMIVLGQTFDCYKKLDYLFDLVFELQKRGRDRIGIVKKSRISNFVEYEQIPFSYDYISEKYGKNILEKDSVSQPFANKKDIDELQKLISILNIPNEIVQTWLDKANAVSLDELDPISINKCIEFLKSKINGEINEH